MAKEDVKVMTQDDLDDFWAKLKGWFFKASSFTKANIKSTLGISDWALAASKPSYGFSEISGKATNAQLQNASITIAGVGVDLGGSISQASLRAGLGLGASAYVGYDTTVTKDSTKLITSGAVWTAIDNLPEPMVFKGSLGTGGTITSLPTNGTASIGDTYKVITAGTYASKAAKVGDTFICLTKTSSANTWELIPSGDEPSGTVTSVGLSMPTGFSVSSSPVTSSGTLTVAFASGYSLPTTAKQSNWDTAYGWGNHASAGYASASSLSNYLPKMGGILYSQNNDTPLTIRTGGTSNTAGLAFMDNASTQFGALYAVKDVGLYFALSNQGGTNSYTVLHSGNSSVSLSGSTLTVKINGVEKSLTNTNTTYSANNGVGLSGTTFYNSGVRAATINGNYLRINTNGTNADLTIPYATKASQDNDGTAFKGNYLRKVSVPNNTENDFNTFENITLTGRGDPTTGASLVHAPWSGAGPSGGYGVLTYLWSGYGIQMAWGYCNNHIYIRNKAYSGNTDVWSNSWSTVALTSDIPTNVSQLTNDSGYVTSSGSVNYAASAGSVAWGNVTSKPATATRWPSWEEVTGKPNDYARSSNMSFTSGSEFVKVSDNQTWNGQVYSKQGYKECRVTYKIGQTNAYIMVGLNSDPTTDASYSSIDYCWYTQSGGALSIYENGSSISSISGHTTYTTGDELIVEYSNGVVRYYHNGVLCRSVNRTYGTPLYFDSSFYTVSGKIYDVYFGPIHNDSSVSKSGETLTVKINGTSQSLTNTWRPLGTGASDACAGNDSRLSNSRPASDVYSWAKQSSLQMGVTTSSASSGVVTLAANTQYAFTAGGSTIYFNTPKDTTYSAATTSAAGLMSAADKTKLNGIATGATAVSESTVSGWGFTKNAGTVTSVKVGTISYSPSSGVVSLPAYPTSLPASDVSAWAKKSSLEISLAGSSASSGVIQLAAGTQYCLTAGGSSLYFSTPAMRPLGTGATDACAGNDSRLSNARTPVAHASSATTYGVGTTSNYGHVKLATGDMNGASGADGVACGKNHTHSQYLPLTGGTVGNGSTNNPLTIYGKASEGSFLKFACPRSGASGQNESILGIDPDGNFQVAPYGSNNAYALLHSGNIGSYKGLTTTTFSGTSLSCSIDTYYRASATINTLAVTLPAVSGSTTRSILLYLTTGTSPNITFTGQNGITVKYYASHYIQANKTYEINVLYNGSVWIVSSAEIS